MAEPTLKAEGFPSACFECHIEIPAKDHGLLSADIHNLVVLSTKLPKF